MGQKLNDEYVWNNYHSEYVAQLAEIKRDDNQDFFITEFEKNEDGGLTFHDNLHPNWMELYETAYRLKPKSILECGCGSSMHLKNIYTISVSHFEAEIHGIDLLKEQLEFGKKFSSLPQAIAENLSVMNMAENKPDRQYEFVYTQAVVMHQSTANAIKMLKNMKETSSKYVFMIEGVKNHENWYDMVKNVFDGWTFSQPNKYVDYSILLTKNG